MSREALVVIDIQNDITKHYRDIIGKINAAVEWASAQGMAVVYIKHHNLSNGTRTFKPGTKGAELAPELNVVSDNVFVKTKANALTSEPFSAFIRDNGIDTFYITGADATACVKSTCYNMAKAGFAMMLLIIDNLKLSELGMTALFVYLPILCIIAGIVLLVEAIIRKVTGKPFKATLITAIVMISVLITLGVFLFICGTMFFPGAR